MTQIIQHATRGTIVYNESFWTGKKSLTVNGVNAQSISKQEFLIDGERALITGSSFTGITLQIGGESIVLLPKTAWYEYVLAILPILFLLTWGNSPALCAIFPVIGGAIGGAIGAILSMTSLLLMKKSRTPIVKLLIGIGMFAVTLLLGFLLASLFLMMIS